MKLKGVGKTAAKADPRSVGELSLKAQLGDCPASSLGSEFLRVMLLVCSLLIDGAGRVPVAFTSIHWDQSGLLPVTSIALPRSPSRPPGTASQHLGPALRNVVAGERFSARRWTGRKRKCFWWYLLGVPSGLSVEARESAMEHVTEGAWESLQVPLHPRVLGALRELGFPHMTPVQVSGPLGSEAERSAA